MQQLEYLYETAQNRKADEYRFLAAIHGVELPDKESDNVVETFADEVEKEFKQAKPSNGLFGDPAEYAKMTDEEKTIASQNLMAKFKNWAKDTSLG